MKHKGIKHLNHTGSGDQIVRINVEVPKKLNSKEKELLKELSGMPNFNSENNQGKKFFSKFGL
jgi:molecular chaperone DnaJ